MSFSDSTALRTDSRLPEHARPKHLSRQALCARSNRPLLAARAEAKRALRAATEGDGGTSQKAIALDLGVDPSRLSRQLDPETPEEKPDATILMVVSDEGFERAVDRLRVARKGWR